MPAFCIVSFFALCALACARPPRACSPAPTLPTSFPIFGMIEGRLGMPTLYAALLSSCSPILSRERFAVCRVRRWCQRWQLCNYTQFQEAVVCVCSPVRNMLVQPLTFGRHADCSGSLALLHSGCVPRANMRYCVWFLFIPLNALIALLARRFRFQHALEDVSFSRKFFRLGTLAR